MKEVNSKFLYMATKMTKRQYLCKVDRVVFTKMEETSQVSPTTTLPKRDFLFSLIHQVVRIAARVSGSI